MEYPSPQCLFNAPQNLKWKKITSCSRPQHRKHLIVATCPCQSLPETFQLPQEVQFVNGNTRRTQMTILKNWLIHTFIIDHDDGLQNKYRRIQHYFCFPTNCSALVCNLGRFPFDQRFRGFRSEIEWNGKNSGKNFRKFRNTFWVHPLWN